MWSPLYFKVLVEQLPNKYSNFRGESMTSSVPSREYALINKIKNECGDAGNSYIMGIGDDCAVRKPASSSTLISADTMVENVHFRLDLMSLKELGFKAVSSSISDIYAMGGTGCSLLIQLVFPKGDKAEEQIEELYRGVGEAVKFFNTPVVGGDIAQGPCWMIAVTVLGDSGRRVIYRNGAVRGDTIWVSGTPGLSGRGLDLMLKHGRTVAEGIDAGAVKAHIAPEPHLELMDYLQEHCSVTSLIDISDGVGKESLTIAEESGVGVIVKLPLPIRRRLDLSEELECRSADELFLKGGEDYELLFTCSEKFVPEHDGVVFSKIGVVSESLQSYFVNGEGKTVDLTGGWDHL